METNDRLAKIESHLMLVQAKLDSLIDQVSKKTAPSLIVEPFKNPEVIKPQKPLEPVKDSIVEPFKNPEVIKPQKPLEPVKDSIVEPFKNQEPVKVNLKMQEAATVQKPMLEPTNAPKELVDLLNSKAWPPAVDASLICDVSSDQDKEDRAEGILDLIIDTNLANLKFLDYGCGEGHVINRSQLHKTKLSVGYDIKKSEKWNTWKLNNAIFTDNWEDVKKSGPYNIILMYDVIDHMLEPLDDIIARMKEIKQLLAQNGKVYVRTHPFCSRHGTHLYHQINKAFIHLVFTEDELQNLGYKQEKVRKVIHPLAEYKAIFDAAGFKIQNGPHQIKEAVEKFFVNNNMVANRIKENYKNSLDTKLRNGMFPGFQLEQQFIDYILT